MNAEPRMRAAVFRPDDERAAAAADLLEALGAEPVVDPMLAVEPTGETPRSGADYVVFTSKTGVELVAGERDDEAAPAERWDPGDATVCAIGESTADSLREHGYPVDRVPDEFSSAGLVDELADEVAGAADENAGTADEDAGAANEAAGAVAEGAEADEGAGPTVEVARSDHGSAVLLEGLREAGADVHETVLYRLDRPDGAGDSAALAADGDLHVALFTSSLTVEHFLDAAAERGVRAAAIDGLNEAVVGAIGEPTAETAESAGIDVDVVPDTADFEALATLTVEEAAPTYHE